MKYIFLIIATILLLFLVLYNPRPLTKLDKVIMSVNLEEKYSPYMNVGCFEGEARPRHATGVQASHCSCLVVKICNEMGVKILQPPEVPQKHLADKQLKWLNREEGRKHGWIKITESSPERQQIANDLSEKGHVVITGIRITPNTNGHIAVVRPSQRPKLNIDAYGPDVITSSRPNSYAESVYEDFKHWNIELGKTEHLMEYFYNKKV